MYNKKLIKLYDERCQPKREINHNTVSVKYLRMLMGYAIIGTKAKRVTKERKNGRYRTFSELCKN